MTTARQLSAPVPPGGMIGILGGGQLGRMLALAAARLGLKTHIFSDVAEAPAFQVSDRHTVAAYDDRAALIDFAAHCDAITYEFENVPARTAAVLAGLKPTYPGARALAVAQDRLEEKTFLKSLGLGTAPFAAVSSVEEARAAFAALGSGPAVLKTRRLGYDGKGQAKVTSANDAAQAFEHFHGAASILESFVDFAFEASVIGARGIAGDFAAYDPPENQHEHHILKRSIVPGKLTGAEGDEAKAIARKVTEALGYVGVIGVELFVTAAGGLLVNEYAPRVHNSGHWTLDACAVSQFEQHIRCVAGWPLGDTARHSDAVMENILGEEAAGWQKLSASGGALHLYGKADIRPGRKMGHITFLSPRPRPR
ncbi:MAG: 5-(carboxyamino)imidazole ribonucleotide synthase [Alphaproteobacteria bacterium]|nr:5-(carboxyamino)imidazole ribonucleotide synthase [Alphaproteobacteria bacterium]MDE2075141.1 5-(carboxyamino)imidazole ribonucleotide synthase [Alphaproteobacteria bacterium]